MTMRRLTPALLVLVLLLAGCSSTESVTTASGDAAASTYVRTVAPPDSLVPATPAEAPRDWHLYDYASSGLPGVSADRAYEELLADREPKRTVVVAVVDNGVDPDHEDLIANMWTNEDEVPGNDRDDDGNGYVDDIHGWNFIGGADGENVSADTYELTRVYADLHERFEDVDPETLSGEERADYERYQELEAEYQQGKAKMEANLQQAKMMAGAFKQGAQLLREALGTDALTVEAVRDLEPTSPQLGQARQMWLQLRGMGVSEGMIDQQVEMLEVRVEHSYDTEFDPRTIVGDDLSDVTDRDYGNTDVHGPDPFHGTHVAGIIGAVRGNAVGMDGIAPAVEIMAVRAVPMGDERDKDVANAIRYAVDNGAEIINMSFGKTLSPKKEWVDEAVRYAEEQGVLLVHGSGNDATNVDEKTFYPTYIYLDGSASSNWIEVGATSWKKGAALPATFSNYGQHVHLFAPGVDIYSTVQDDGYRSMGGTSMASPVVAGVAALVMAYYPELSAREVRQILLDSALSFADYAVTQPKTGASVPFSELSAAGGIVNAYEALRLAEQRTR